MWNGSQRQFYLSIPVATTTDHLYQLNIPIGDYGVMTHESWERIPDTIRVRISSWETYSIKAWEGWDPEGGSRYSASQAITSPDKRSGDFFWFIFCFFWSRESVELLRQNAWQKQVAHGVWGETKVHYGDLLRSGTSLFFCWFTMEWRPIFFDILRNVCDYVGNIRVVLF